MRQHRTIYLSRQRRKRRRETIRTLARAGATIALALFGPIALLYACDPSNPLGIFPYRIAIGTAGTIAIIAAAMRS